MKFADAEQKEFEAKMRQERESLLSRNKNHFEEWLKTEHGLKCSVNDRPAQPYLNNRLWWAFEAGLSVGESGHRLQSTIDWYEIQRKEDRQKIKRLTKELKKLQTA